MKKCPKCFKEHILNGRFCSKKCGNSRSWSVEHKSSLAVTAKMNHAKRTPEERKRIVSKAIEATLKNSREKFETSPFELLSVAARKKKILIEQNGKCLWCGNDEWLGKPLLIEIDHIDGNRKNIYRENLRGLCPNCHSQTPTYKVLNRRAL